MEGAAVLRRLTWQLAEVIELHEETSRVGSIVLVCPDWLGHRAGQHVDVRLTAEDGYQAQRSYSIASAPEDERLVLTVERIDDGEVSPYLVGELRPGDKLELRGPIGGYFAWDASLGGPLLLVAAGSGIVPLMAMLRHRVASGSEVPARLLYSSRSFDDVIYRPELDALATGDGEIRVAHTLTRSSPPGWDGYRRRLDEQMLAEVGFAPAERPLIYACGPTGFVEVAASALVALGHASESIKTERFGPTGG